MRPRMALERATAREVIDLSVRVGINGFGRIGRNFLRSVLKLEAGPGDGPGIEIVAINDLVSLEANAHLLRYDSTFGRLDAEVTRTDKGLRVGGHEITVFEERDPKAIGWGGENVDVVIESTGRFTSREARRRPPRGGCQASDHLCPRHGGRRDLCRRRE